MAHGQDGGGLPPLQWMDDNNAAVWKLVSLLQVPENRRKLFGKDPSDVKSTQFELNVYLADPASV